MAPKKNTIVQSLVLLGLLACLLVCFDACAGSVQQPCAAAVQVGWLSVNTAQWKARWLGYVEKSSDVTAKVLDDGKRNTEV